MTFIVSCLSPHMRQYLVVITVNLTMFCSGMGLVWTSPMLPKLRQEDNWILGRPITDLETSWLVSIMFFSTMLFTFFASFFLVQRIGRKMCIIIGNFPRMICYILMLTASNAWMLVLGRFLAGCADGFSYSIIPMYMSEIASKEIRGSLATFMQILTTFGGLFMYAVGPYLSYMAINLIVLSACVLTTIPLFLLPESPYASYTMGKKDESKKTLLFLRGSNKLVEDEIKEFEVLNYNKDESEIGIREILKNKTVVKTIVIMCTFSLIGQWNGYLALQTYLQTILESTGTTIQPELSSVIVGFIQFISCSCAVFICDRFNRKTIMVTSLSLQAIGMINVGIYFWIYVRQDEISSFVNVLPLISIVLIFIAFNAGLGSVFWSFKAEIFSGPARPYALGCMIACSSTSSFTCTYALTPMVNSIGYSWSFWLFAFVCMMQSFILITLLPETKGRTFAEIQDALAGISKNKARQKIGDE